jgi:hypothetical protein
MGIARARSGESCADVGVSRFARDLPVVEQTADRVDDRVP